MMKRLILGLLLLLSITVPAQVVSEIGTGTEMQTTYLVEQDLPWPLNMQSRLDAMMRDPLLDDTQLGIMVWDLTDDYCLFCMNHRQLLRPASTMKLLTAITAIDVLGSEYQFTTSLYYKGIVSGHTLQGDLYCVGGMDPAFSTDDMKGFAESLKQLGIDTIDGAIVVDTSMKDTLKWGEGWCWDDDNPTLTPLLIDRKEHWPHADRSASKHRSSQTDTDDAIARILCDQGITLYNMTVVEGSLPADAVLVSERRRSIRQILERMMKDSDNLYAESMYYQIGAMSNRPAKALHAQRLEKALIERTGLDSSRYRLADGSGLSLYNYLSAELEVRILRYAYQHRQVYATLLPALPIAGEDGTLKRRMKGTSAEGNVQAKTGTLTGVISLAGYCTASNGHRLCFAIMNQGIQKGSVARAYQDKICSILCD